MAFEGYRFPPRPRRKFTRHFRPPQSRIGAERFPVRVLSDRKRSFPAAEKWDPRASRRRRRRPAPPRANDPPIGPPPRSFMFFPETREDRFELVLGDRQFFSHFVSTCSGRSSIFFLVCFDLNLFHWVLIHNYDSKYKFVITTLNS